ncbi:MAG: transcription antitermination factor NusB [Dehalococcoidales bacterium]|jgi:N utilization substance protein B|nr:transcription antitermination factor NusB [Dehalococcoidales bacterium]|tara:strand:- start:70 stop:486 length:417 start_codon:yes stop_codon:yes gene_type:complete
MIVVAARRKARALVLQTLYEVDSTGHAAGEVLDRLLLEDGLPKDNAGFARNLVTGVIENKEGIDQNIHTFAPAWPLEQIPLIDRNILRLAIFEILINNEVPVKVAINEAVELAKAFGAASSSKFVNGVLGSVSALANR